MDIYQAGHFFRECVFFYLTASMVTFSMMLVVLISETIEDTF